jgi:4-amino-4-deoxy-L-arabinose transferase-like glycosyltransferase
MYLPYTDNFPEAVTVAAQSVAATLTAVIWSRPLRTRSATILFGVAIWMAALTPLAPSMAGVLHLEPGPRYFSILQISATLAIVAALLDGSRRLGVLAAVGQCALYALAHYVRDSDAELSFAYIFFYGVLIGVHALRGAPPSQAGPTSAKRSFARQDVAIFLVTTCLAALVTNLVFGRLIFNGDEVANSFQADVYGHLRASAPIPPCPSMFENYWIFRHHGHAFSQYTPGWPLFMAPFQRLGIIWLAGPVMGGLLAVALARLSRRLASGLGTTPEESERIVVVAGLLGPIFAMLGPYLLLNSASRFSHTMVCACFAWAVESLCAVSSKSESLLNGRRDWGYGFLLGAATSLGLATRPADGATLGVGIFLYFLWAVAHRRITWRAFLGTAIGFLLFGGLTAVILRLQLGAWFQTGYTISPSIHPESELHLSWPEPNQWKNGIPLATGSYGWWPAAPALGIAGLLRALGGRERRVAFMLATSALLLLGFYFFVEFTRGSYEGLGPRYVTPLVVPMATGGACLLAPLFERARALRSGFRSGIGSVGPALLALLALAYGVIRLGPHEYPVAYAENKYSTAPLRAARQARLKNAIVLIEPDHVPADKTNLAQNPPMNPNPDVLFLIRRGPADEVCARQHFPGRKWYRAGMTQTLTPY